MWCPLFGEAFYSGWLKYDLLANLYELQGLFYTFIFSGLLPGWGIVSHSYIHSSGTQTKLQEGTFTELLASSIITVFSSPLFHPLNCTDLWISKLRILSTACVWAPLSVFQLGNFLQAISWVNWELIWIHFPFLKDFLCCLFSSIWELCIIYFIDCLFGEKNKF